MILIADGGSTKTDWRLVNNDGIENNKIQTTGFNPYNIDTIGIQNILWSELQPYVDVNSVDKIYYYGTGCSTPTKVMTVETAIQNVFTDAKVYVEHDMLAAARAVCGKQAGITAILGTGANSCVFNGEEITQIYNSLGYFLGDEGSGAHLGKTLLYMYFHDELSPELKMLFEKEFPLTLENILDGIYNKPMPNRFLASFSTFFLNNKENEEVRNILENVFDKFYKYMVLCYPESKTLPVNFAGSIGYIYQEALKKVGEKIGVKTGNFVKDPIEALIEYHRNYML